MKKLCYGLLLACSIMLGLSLNACSDVNALKYDITTIPFANLMPAGDYYSRGARSPYYEPFSIGFDSTSIGGNLVWHKPAYFYNLLYNSQTGKCEFDGRTGNARPGLVMHNNGSSYSLYQWYFPYYDSNLISYDSSIDNITKCNIVGRISQDITGLPGYVFGNPNYDSFKPYRYNYDGLYVKSSGDVNGVHLNNRLDLGELFGCDVDHLDYCHYNNTTNTYGNFPSVIKRLILPLGVFTNVSDVSTNSSVVISGRLSFGGRDINDTFELSTDPAFNITSEYTLPNANGSGAATFTSSCTYDLIDWREADPNGWWYDLTFSCPITLSRYTNENFIGFTVLFDNGWTYPTRSVVLYDFQVVTNGDITPSGMSFTEYVIDGNESNTSPGAVESDFDSPSSETNWLTSLTNLFNFTTLNPFAPLFNLFADNSSCASIPIIAGMLNTEETTYCPWFSSDTRNILTPVLGLAGAMLVFGFFVRWLGASSGNMFEDSGHIESPGTGRSGDQLVKHGWRRK